MARYDSGLLAHKSETAGPFSEPLPLPRFVGQQGIPSPSPDMERKPDLKTKSQPACCPSHARYDEVNNKRTILEKGGSITTYVNDARDRLVGEQRTGTGSYQMAHVYDGTDNRTRWENTASPFVTDTTYDPATRIVTYVADSILATCMYSAPRNLTLDTGQALTMVYDEENRMTRLDSVAQVASYAYDGDNLKRLEIALNGATTTIIWDGTDYLGDVT